MSRRITPLFAVLVLAATLVCATSAVAVGQEPYTLTILHAGDTHAHIESITPSGGTPVGGVARRLTAIQRVRDEGGNVLPVDSGDAFQGKLFFNKWQGEEEAYFMSALVYQAMVVGNHEFDSGPGTLGSFIRGAAFPVLSANIDSSAETALDDEILPCTILTVGEGRIGVIGLTSTDTPSMSSPGGTVVFSDVLESARQAVAALEEQGISRIVALVHIGYPADQELAHSVRGIDAIVGGHSHTLLGNMEGAVGDYPTVITGSDGGTTLVVHATSGASISVVSTWSSTGKAKSRATPASPFSSTRASLRTAGLPKWWQHSPSRSKGSGARSSAPARRCLVAYGRTCARERPTWGTSPATPCSGRRVRKPPRYVS